MASGSIRWARVLLLLLIVAVVGEAGSRLLIRKTTGRPFASLDAYTFSGYGLYRQNPNYTHPQFVHNSVGFRNLREFELDKPDGTFRVMLIGASVLYSGSAASPTGMSQRVRTEETISAFLQPMLAALPELAGMDVEVMNTGVNRHYLRQTLSYYVAELARYDPDLVVVFGTHNDSARIEQVDALSTMFYDKQRPTPEEVRLEMLVNESSVAAVAEKGIRAAVNTSAFAATSYRTVDRVLLKIAARINARKSMNSNPQVGELATPEQREKHLRYYLAGLDSLLSYIETQGAQPVVFWEYLLMLVEEIKPLSPYEQAQRDFLANNVGTFTDEHKAIKFEIQRNVAEHLAARGTPLVDIRDDLPSYSGTLYNDYLHYAPDGNRWVAEILARDLQPLIAERLR